MDSKPPVAKPQNHLNQAFIVLVALTCCIFSPKLLREGLFFDGLTYSSISMNFLENHQSWWDLKYTSALFDDFFEHPPFHFWLQSLFFNIVSPQHLFAEKIYSLSLFLLTSFILLRFCKMSSSDINAPFRPQLVLITGLCWLSTGMTEFVFSYNMLDGTLCALATLAVFLYVASIASPKDFGLRFFFFTAASLITACAFLTKGPVGLFPLATPALALLFLKNQTERGFLTNLASAFAYSLGATTFTALFLALITTCSPGGWDFLQQYFSQQVMAALSGRRSTVGSQPRLIVLFKILLTMNFFGCAVVLLTRRLSWRSDRNTKNWTLFFFSLAFAASLPIGISHKIYRFYFMPAMAFYALAFGHLAIGLTPNRLGVFFTNIKVRRNLTALFVFAAVIVTSYNLINIKKPHRDGEVIATVHQLLPHANNQTINYCGNTHAYALYSYAYRYGKISLEYQEKNWTKNAPTLVGPQCKNLPLTNFLKGSAQGLELNGFRLLPAENKL